MGQLTIRHNLSPNSRRNPNPNPLTGQIKILRRGDPPTAFLERETPSPPSSDHSADFPGATCPCSGGGKSKEKRKKTRRKKKEKVGFRVCEDVELLYSATCRIGPEPEMVPLPLSLLRKALF